MHVLERRHLCVHSCALANGSLCQTLGQTGACEIQEDAGAGADTAGGVRWDSPSSPVPWSLRQRCSRQVARASCAKVISSHQSYWKTFLWGMDGYQEVQTLLGEREILILNVVISGFGWPCFCWWNDAFSRFLYALFSNAVAHNIEMISLEEDRDE